MDIVRIDLQLLDIFSSNCGGSFAEVNTGSARHTEQLLSPIEDDQEDESDVEDVGDQRRQGEGDEDHVDDLGVAEVDVEVWVYVQALEVVLSLLLRSVLRGVASPERAAPIEAALHGRPCDLRECRDDHCDDLQ